METYNRHINRIDKTWKIMKKVEKQAIPKWVREERKLQKMLDNGELEVVEHDHAEDESCKSEDQ